MDQKYEREVLRRSIAMLSPGAAALSREDALRLFEELRAVQRRLDARREGLRRLVEADHDGARDR